MTKRSRTPIRVGDTWLYFGQECKVWETGLVYLKLRMVDDEGPLMVGATRAQFRFVERAGWLTLKAAL